MLVMALRTAFLLLCNDLRTDIDYRYALESKFRVDRRLFVGVNVLRPRAWMWRPRPQEPPITGRSNNK